MRDLELDELSPWHRLFAEAGGDDAILHSVNAVGTVRWNAAFAYLDPARGRENLTILGDTIVDRILLDRTRAVGAVTARGELRAETVVVASGAYGSPGILLRSGVEGLPVGEGLLDHVGVGFAFEPTDRMREELAAFEASRPLWMGQVTVRGRSSACPEGLCDERDSAALVQGVELVREFVEGEQFRPYVAAEERPGADVPAADYVRAAARGFFHPTGTCAIGSVVDERCRVLGYEGLIVADASVMPEIPRANTNLTVAAVAGRVADMLR